MTDHDPGSFQPERASIPTVGPMGPWADISTIPEKPGHYNIRSVTTYRWHPYKVPQNGRKGRWQAANEYGGWDNAQLPFGGDWTPNPPRPTAGYGAEGGMRQESQAKGEGIE